MLKLFKQLFSKEYLKKGFLMLAFSQQNLSYEEYNNIMSSLNETNEKLAYKNEIKKAA